VRKMKSTVRIVPMSSVRTLQNLLLYLFNARVVKVLLMIHVCFQQGKFKKFVSDQEGHI
jgi:hypothetical protein